ncbi:glycosyltransferase [Brumimicrobium mesophilum]|uniref:glycosyltransferase n=1 Tax=Brumimicrobium mesophilum TaxID=392717 RepID=UPI000D143CF3|nr:glycosyltransferase [Brumimicrobium mesophilum]
MKIALCSIGSRGDIQPFLVLAEYFKSQGHEVKVSSAEMYAEMAQKYKIDYVPFPGDYTAIVDNDALKKEIGKNPFTIGKALKEKVYPIMENSLETFYEMVKWCDIVVYHPKTMIDSISKDMQHKLIKAYVVPAFTPTSEFANPLLTFLPLPHFLNKLTFKFTNAMIGVVKTPVNNFKQRNNLPKSKFLLDTPTIYGISSSLLKRPDDYPQDHFFTGFWIKKDEKEDLLQEIVDFTSCEKQVLIITFGSMPYKSDIDINDFIAAILEEHDIKILVVKAWGLKDIRIKENKNVLAIDSAPFDSLFPMADFVIHHGGAGTMATAITAGIPQMVCPVLHPFGDQYFWGKQLQKQGVGVKPIPLKKLKIKSLLKGIEGLKSEELKIKALELREKVKMEDGLKAALRIVEGHYKTKNQ